ncbi:hypothetical protein Y10_15930 [Neptunitalea sp. Y10]|uniref:Thioredoxin-like fold domain-containing protein n=1 Tax=Neptunitalea lumnitzerae TaxID=2965509 RepID=A0ABQ5MIK7_9FLAO|nr:hypothetical protein Y10_15930 [Neptunitalea sp. Y10]
MSCGNDDEVYTYFGGQIVNPKHDYVVLYKNDNAFDSVKLDAHNRFSFRFDKLEGGIYKFSNQPEHQYIILEQGDSLLLRLNTMDFDESLVFSGKGAKKNNILISQFLQDEEDKKLIKEKFFKLPPIAFKNKIDSIHDVRSNKLGIFYTNQHPSLLTQELLETNLDLTLYRYVEIYPYVHHKLYDEKVDETELTDAYYNFRDHINFNEEKLGGFYPYQKYLKLYASGKSYINVSDAQPELTAKEVVKTYPFHINKLKYLEEAITDKSVKDIVLRNAAYMFFLDEERDLSLDQEYLEEFKKYAGNNQYLPEITEIYNTISALQAGNKITDVHFINEEGNQEDIYDITNNTLTVYYFWSLKQKNHFHNILKRVHELHKDFPKVNFVGVNLDLPQNEWRNTLKKFNLNTENQYRVTDFNKTNKKLLLNKMNKVIVLDHEGIIVNAFADIYDIDFTSLLSTTQKSKNLAHHYMPNK